MRIALLFEEDWETAPRIEHLFLDAGHEPVVNPEWHELDGFDAGMVRANYWEPGLGDMFAKALVLEARGAPSFNSIAALLRCADKAVSGELLRTAGLDVPATWIADPGQRILASRHGWVVKPRTGSHQCAVEVFADRAPAQAYLDSCSTAQLVQERIVGRYWRVIATAERSLRTYTMPVDSRGVTALPKGRPRGVVEAPDPGLEEVGVRVVRALGGTMMGVDVIEDGDGRHWAIEGNAGFGFNLGDEKIERAMIDEAEGLLDAPVLSAAASGRALS